MFRRTKYNSVGIVDWTCQHQNFKVIFKKKFFLYVFSNPTSPPWSFIGLVQCMVKCVPPYTLRSLAFKGVTPVMDFIKAGNESINIIVWVAYMVDWKVVSYNTHLWRLQQDTLFFVPDFNKLPYSLCLQGDNDYHIKVPSRIRSTEFEFGAHSTSKPPPLSLWL